MIREDAKRAALNALTGFERKQNHRHPRPMKVDATIAHILYMYKKRKGDVPKSKA